MIRVIIAQIIASGTNAAEKEVTLSCMTAPLLLSFIDAYKENNPQLDRSRTIITVRSACSLRYATYLISRQVVVVRAAAAAVISVAAETM